MQYYFSRGRQSSERQSECAIAVNNCGYYREMDAPIEIVRPNGRVDFHLLFCANGRITVGNETLENGDVYLYFPNERQEYLYESSPESRYFWAHFSGTDVVNLLHRCGLVHGKHTCNLYRSELESLFRLMITELDDRKSGSAELAASLLSSILLLLPRTKQSRSPFSRAVRRLEDFSSPISVDELADMYKMSNGHFIRSFKSYFGVCPLQYRRGRQIRLSKMLLVDSRLSVSEIASRAGFEDPLYFSRAFRKATSLSPSDYRKKHGDV